MSSSSLEWKESSDKTLQTTWRHWLNTWDYQKDNLFKIKTSFAQLLKWSLVDGKLVSTPIVTTIDNSKIESLELDHLIAQNANENSVFSFDAAERDLYINGLGNMMLLPKKENIKKSDRPLEHSFEYYEKAGLGSHFLIVELKKCVEQVLSKEITAVEFVNQRKEKLIHYFSEIYSQ